VRYLLNVNTLEYNPELCTGCRRCVEVCPHAVFEMKDRKARFVDKNRCMECGACQQNCDTGALKVQTGVGCSAAILQSIFTGKPAVCGTGDGSGAGCC